MINDGDSTSSTQSFSPETPVADKDTGSVASSALHKLRSIKYGFRKPHTTRDPRAKARRHAKKIKKFPRNFASNANYAS